MKKIFLIILLVFQTVFSFSQAINYTGVWNGKFYDNTSFGLKEDQYRFEIQIAQTGKGLEGVTYSYLNTTFYGKATHNGFVKTEGNKLIIQENKLVEVRSIGGGACLMTCTMKYSKVGKDEFLEGTFTARDSKGGTPCDGGYVKLKKVQKSIFGIAPIVQNKINANAKIKKKAPLIVSTKPKQVVAKPPVAITKPKPKPPIVASKPKPIISKPPVVVTKPKPIITKPPVVVAKPKPIIVTKPPVVINKPPIIKKDSAKNITVISPPAKVVIPPPPPILNERKTVVVQTIDVVDSTDLALDFYDYGVPDGDMVTIYVNNVKVIDKQVLKTTPITVHIKVDAANPETTVTMYADNLGTIPPNTAYMVVYIKDQKYEATIETTEQKNASIKFLYKGK